MREDTTPKVSQYSACALCAPSAHTTLWQDDFCRVVLLNDADYPAYCRVELVAHVKEMTDLAPVQRAQMMKVVFAVELAVREVVNPYKINLASLGNKTPHLHWHVIPRFGDDKHFPNSHWGEPVRANKEKALDTNKINLLAKTVASHIKYALNSNAF